MVQVKKAEIRDAIVTCAYRLFRSQGYSGTSMAQIGRAAGVAPSNIYVYFDSKFEIFYAVYEPWLKQRLGRLEQELEAIADPQGRLRRILETIWIDLPTEDNGFANNLMQAVSTATQQERYRSDLLSRCEAILSDLLSRALPPDRAAIVEHGRLAHILLMAFDGFVVRFHLGANRGDMGDVIALMSDLMSGSIASGMARDPKATGEHEPESAVAEPLTRRPRKRAAR